MPRAVYDACRIVVDSLKEKHTNLQATFNELRAELYKYATTNPKSIPRYIEVMKETAMIEELVPNMFLLRKDLTSEEANTYKNQILQGMHKQYPGVFAEMERSKESEADALLNAQQAGEAEETAQE